METILFGFLTLLKASFRFGLEDVGALAITRGDHNVSSFPNR